MGNRCVPVKDTPLPYYYDLELLDGTVVRLPGSGEMMMKKGPHAVNRAEVHAVLEKLRASPKTPRMPQAWPPEGVEILRFDIVADTSDIPEKAKVKCAVSGDAATFEQWRDMTTGERRSPAAVHLLWQCATCGLQPPPLQSITSCHAAGVCHPCACHTGTCKGGNTPAVAAHLRSGVLFMAKPLIHTLT